MQHCSGDLWSPTAVAERRYRKTLNTEMPGFQSRGSSSTDQDKPIAKTMMNTVGKWILRLLSVALLIIIVTIAVTQQLSPEHRAKLFVNHWANLFRTCENISAIRALPRPDCIYIREFTNQQWVAIRMEHSCCTGAGYDATVLRDSTGTIRFDTTHTFCGYEGLCGELGHVQANDLAGFYVALTNLNLTIWKPR